MGEVLSNRVLLLCFSYTFYLCVNLFFNSSDSSLLHNFYGDRVGKKLNSEDIHIKMFAE